MEQVKIANITQKTIRPADKTGYIEVKFRTCLLYTSPSPRD